jgi:signal transduction histidine kinase
MNSAFTLNSRRNRALRLAVIFAIAPGLIVADFTTWIELDIATIFGLPLLLAGVTGSLALLWTLTALLVATIFVVYAVQIPANTFALDETFFVNRVLDAVSLLILAGLLHVWMRSVAARAAQARLIKEQEEKLQAAMVSRRMLEVQEGERRAVASQLHDLVGQKLTALSINLTIAKSQLAPGESMQIGPRLDDSMKMVEETTEHIRDVMTELRPAVLDDFGLAPALRWYAEQFTHRTGVVTSVVEEGAARRLAPTAEHALFRMAQNALANVARHAHADKAVMTLRTSPQSTCLTVADDGDGFDPMAVHPPTRDHGWGLMIMRERAAAIGAHLNVVSAPGHGTSIVVTIDGDAHDQGSAGG